MDSDTKRPTHRNTSNGTAMATHTSPSQALVPQVNPAFDTFMVFETLPKELRHMIWRASFEPRRLWLWGNCLSLDAMTGRFLLVNWEANTEFSRAYHFMFLGRHGFPKGVLVNPEKDTLHFNNGLRKVEEFGYRWPEDMAKIRYIEVCPDFESRRQHMWRSVNIGLADGPDPAYDRFTDMAWHLMGPMRGKPTQFLEEVESYFSFLRDVPNLMDSQFLPVTGQGFLQANKHLKEILENPLVGVAATINGQFLRLHESCSVCQG